MEIVRPKLTQTVSVRLSKEDEELLHYLAKEAGVKVTDLHRYAVRKYIREQVTRASQE